MEHPAEWPAHAAAARNAAAAAAGSAARPPPASFEPSWVAYACGPAALLISGPTGASLPNLPLVPDIITRRGQKLDAIKDPAAIMESCLARAVMSTGGGASRPPGVVRCVCPWREGAGHL
jgi:hypothetical protein